MGTTMEVGRRREYSRRDGAMGMVRSRAVAFDPQPEIWNWLLKFRGKVWAQDANVGVAGTKTAFTEGHPVSRPGSVWVHRASEPRDILWGEVRDTDQ